MAAGKLQRLKQRKAQLDARIQREESRQRNRERKADTRRKILLGALLSDWMDKDDALRRKVRRRLDRYLTRKIDREVFDLALRDDDETVTDPRR